ncbi:hypothetical protein NEOLEDRAFT_1150808 [Neolentinus lepideus HHB14362 ss-1]|uniref:Uncharacterized protein n=1 Tax=Neolentinus lepideus HHB14362 ss-1 TaxID=1314782 RepID=A0A165PM68_9AGAM|nr:hypothetical protein NEOLEDRAFT_1150808 [Neolentinus lepideus HHB14362 ss-1]
MVMPPPGPFGFTVHMVAAAVRQPNGLDLCGPVVGILVEQLRSIDEEGAPSIDPHVAGRGNRISHSGGCTHVGASPLPLLANYPTRSTCFLKVFVPPIYPPVVDPITLTGAATTIRMPTAPLLSSSPEAVTLPSTEPCVPTPAPTIPSATPSDCVAGLGSSGSMGSTPIVPITVLPEADPVASPAHPSPGPVSSTNPDLRSTGGKSRTSPDTAITLMGWLAYPKDEVPKGLKSLVHPNSLLSKSEWKFILCLAKWGVSYSKMIPVIESARLTSHAIAILPSPGIWHASSVDLAINRVLLIFLGTAFDRSFNVEGRICDYQQQMAAYPKVFKKLVDDSEAHPAIAPQTPIGNPSVTVPRKWTTVSIVPEMHPSVRAVQLKLADPIEKMPRPVVTTKPEAGPSSTWVVPFNESMDTLCKDPCGFVLGLIECKRRLGQLFDFLLSDSHKHLASLEVLAGLLAPATDDTDDSQSSDSDEVDELTESPPYVGKGKGCA